MNPQLGWKALAFHILCFLKVSLQVHEWEWVSQNWNLISSLRLSQNCVEKVARNCNSISQDRLQGIQFIKTIQNLFHEIIFSNGQNMMNLHSGCAGWKAFHITMKSFSLEIWLIGIWPAPLTMIFSNWQNIANLHSSCTGWKGFHIAMKYFLDNGNLSDWNLASSS